MFILKSLEDLCNSLGCQTCPEAGEVSLSVWSQLSGDVTKGNGKKDLTVMFLSQDFFIRCQICTIAGCSNCIPNKVYLDYIEIFPLAKVDFGKGYLHLPSSSLQKAELHNSFYHCIKEQVQFMFWQPYNGNGKKKNSLLQTLVLVTCAECIWWSRVSHSRIEGRECSPAEMKMCLWKKIALLILTIKRKKKKAFWVIVPVLQHKSSQDHHFK